MTGAAGFTVRARAELAGATLANGRGLVATFLDNGVLFGLHADDVMVNLVLGSPMGGGLGNIFLRASRWFIDAPDLTAGGNYWATADASTATAKIKGRVSILPWKPATAAGY